MRAIIVTDLSNVKIQGFCRGQRCEEMPAGLSQYSRLLQHPEVKSHVLSSMVKPVKKCSLSQGPDMPVFSIILLLYCNTLFMKGKQ
jgi:hypothetical protein